MVWLWCSLLGCVVNLYHSSIVSRLVCSLVFCLLFLQHFRLGSAKQNAQNAQKELRRVALCGLLCGLLGWLAAWAAALRGFRPGLVLLFTAAREGVGGVWP